MKYTYLTIIAFFYLTACFAQETVERRNKLADNVIEKFYVLKANPEIKQGPYKAFYNRKTTIAYGNYTQDKKTGTWNFYGISGKLIEKFNYDTNTLMYEGPLDVPADFGFLFDKKTKPTDTVTRPLKIGGTCYGFIPYLSIFKLPFDTFEINMDDFEAVVELLISPGGRLADYKVHLTSAYYEYDKTISMDINLFSEDDKIFIPATINKEPVLSRILIKCFINNNDGLDFY